MKKMTRGVLTPYEIAALTAGVPASGDGFIDAIITQGLRFKAAVSFLEGMASHSGVTGLGAGNVRAAMDAADELIAEFSKEK